MAHTVFIDGEAGTTGLQIRDRLADRADLEVLSIDPEHRKDAEARRELLNAADAVVLCLPDDASREAVSMISSDRTKVVDASTAFRTAPGWVYGFPEMAPGHRAAVREATRVANPGCYPTGFIALVQGTGGVSIFALQLARLLGPGRPVLSERLTQAAVDLLATLAGVWIDRWDSHRARERQAAPPCARSDCPQADPVRRQ